MANRNFSRFQALEREVKAIYAEISIGAAGEPTLVQGLGVASVVRSSDGVLVITLQDKYNKLMHASASILSISAQDLQTQLQAEDVDNAKTVTIRTQDATALATDAADGSTIFVRLDLKNSSVR